MRGSRLEGSAWHARLVLVVDDDPLVGATIAADLAARGHHALHVRDYERAAQLAETAEPRVVVVDEIVGSPGARGLLLRIRALGPSAPRVVVIRYEPEPPEVDRGALIVVGGARWFEELPAAVGRALEPT